MVVLGICGTRESGKSTVCEYLCTQKFKHYRLDPSNPETSKDALTKVMEDWRSNWVVEPFSSIQQLEVFSKRPLFLLISVDAPLLSRFSWHEASCQDTASCESFLEFCQKSDEQYYNGSLHDVMAKAEVRLLNSGTLKELRCLVDDFELTNPEWIRPGWDTYFMRLADLASSRSNCMKRRVGAVLVHNNCVVSTGYNGTPRGVRNCNEGGCARCNSNTRCGVGLDECLCLHAEENAIIEAGRDRSRGSVLYTSSLPCLGCTKKIIQASITEVIFSSAYAMGMDAKSSELLAEAGVILRQHSDIRPRQDDLNISFSECFLSPKGNTRKM